MDGYDLKCDEVISTEDLRPIESIDPIIFDEPAFQYFRSWYKGGRVCERLQFWNSAARLWARQCDDIVSEQENAESEESATIISLNDSVAEDYSPPKNILAGEKKPEFVYDIEEGKKTAASRLKERALLLQKRMHYVESQKKIALQLLDLHKMVESKSLRFGDLQTKRNALSKQDIDALMGSRKLAELCRCADVEVFRLPGQYMQRVCKADIFCNSPKNYLTPDSPPPLVLSNDENGGKMPVKLWSTCSDLEKELECRLACMLDFILELAVIDGIYVPSLEDADIDEGLVPTRSHKWKKFMEWYIGPEKASGDSISFSKARIEFSDWEKRSAGVNFLVHLRVRGKPPTTLVNPENIPTSIENGDENSVDSASVASESTRLSVEESLEPVGLSAEDQLMRIKKQQDIVTDSYVDIANTQNGASIRIDLLMEYLSAINSSRYASVMRCMWPSAPPRQATQFMFPRMGLITPAPEVHTLHMKLYASRKIDGYTTKDIQKFYSLDELNSDDIKMQKAEEKGKKFEQYIIWLSKEKERLAEGREMMLAEDVAGMKFRIMQENLSRNLVAPPGNPYFSAYSMAGSLSGNYNDVVDGTIRFSDGDGSLNEDEIYDIKDDMIRCAREGFLALQEKKRIALEEQKKAEELERINAEKRERDKRIQEGVVRRQNIRSKLALIKQERELKLMIAHRDKLLEEEEEKKRLALELAEQMVLKKKQEELNNEAKELFRMREEENRQRDLERLCRDRMDMTNEDNMSSIREDYEASEKEILEERIRNLKELYTKLSPFQFEKRRVEVGWLNDDDKEPFYNRIEVPASPTGSRFRSEETKRKAGPTIIQKPDGKIVYPLTKSSKFHTTGTAKHIRSPNISVKKNRFDTPQLSSPIIERKVIKLLPNASDCDGSTNSAVSPVHTGEVDTLETKLYDHNKETKFSPDPYLPAASVHSSSVPNLPILLNQSKQIDKSVNSAILSMDPVLPLIQKNNSKTPNPDPPSTIKTKKKHKPEGTVTDDVKYLSSRDVIGYQNRKKLLSSSLSSLDRQKEILKAPRARVKEFRHQQSKRMVEKVQREKADVSAYLTEAAYNEVLEDKYYIMACEPGVREYDSVNASKKETVKSFRNTLFSECTDLDELEGDLANVFSQNHFLEMSKEPYVSLQKSLNDDDSLSTTDGPNIVSLQKSLNDDDSLTTTGGPNIVGKLSECSENIVDDLPEQDVMVLPGAYRTMSPNALLSRPTTSDIPIELEYPADKIDYRQINVPPPFYRKTFGVLGERKNIEVNPKFASGHKK